VSRIPASSRYRHAFLLGAILVLGVALRLYAINAPPADHQSWRQTQTLMVARNFYRHGMNLFKPSVDWLTTTRTPERRPVGGTELCVVPYLTAGLYFLFGVQHWVGRIVPILFSLLGVVYFYRLARRFYSPTCALLGSLLLTLSPFFLFTGRAQMPESFAFAMTFAALFYYDRWAASSKNACYGRAIAFTALMLLAKPQMAVTAIPMFFLTVHRRGRRAFREGRLYLFAAATVLPSLVFYYYSYVILIPRSGVSFAQPVLSDLAFLAKPEYWTRMATSICAWNVGPIVSVLAAIGLFIPPFRAKVLFPVSWLAAGLALLVLAPGGNNFNSYYQMIFVPPALLLACRALSLGFARRRTRLPAALALIAVVPYSVYIASQLYSQSYISDYHCGRWLRDQAPEDALVVCSSDSPATLYFADRMGWISWWQNYGEWVPFNEEFIDTTGRLGASVLAVTDARFDNAYYAAYAGIRDRLYDSFLCYKGEDFTIFNMTRPADLALPADGRVAFGLRESRKYLRAYWGPDDADGKGVPCVSLGPGPVGQIRFVSPGKPAAITLDLASAAPDQQVDAYVNGKKLATATIAFAGRRGFFPIEHIPEADADGRYTITLETTRQDANRVSLILYGLEITP